MRRLMDKTLLILLLLVDCGTAPSLRSSAAGVGDTAVKSALIQHWYKRAAVVRLSSASLVLPSLISLDPCSIKNVGFNHKAYLLHLFSQPGGAVTCEMIVSSSDIFCCCLYSEFKDVVLTPCQRENIALIWWLHLSDERSSPPSPPSLPPRHLRPPPQRPSVSIWGTRERIISPNESNLSNHWLLLQPRVISRQHHKRPRTHTCVFCLFLFYIWTIFSGSDFDEGVTCNYGRCSQYG